MICPLMLAAGNNAIASECLKEQCAWYSDYHCAIKGIAHNMENLQENVRALREYL